MADQTSKQNAQVSRRGFLKSAIIAAASIPVLSAGCSPEEERVLAQPNASSLPMQLLNPDVPLAPTIPPNSSVLRTFTPHEAQTVEAITARILPGTPEDPGAREAGVVTYIDNMLAYHEGFTETTYREPPYAQLYSGDTPPETNGSFETVWIPADQIERYGVQSILSPREVYRLGVMGVDQYARSKFEKLFIDLSEEEQDSMIKDMVSGDAKIGFEQFSAPSFFTILRRHTAEGMFSDPAHGCNRNMAGWKLLGYPGAQRAYTEADIRTEAHTPREPQSLAQLHPFSPGEYAGSHVVLPVSGSEEGYPVFHDHP